MFNAKQYDLKKKHKLSPEMFLSLCYFAQDHEYRGFVHGRTLKALQRRRFVDKEGELTTSGWECYIEITDAGPCGIAAIAGATPKDPHDLFEKAKPRLAKIASDRKNQVKLNRETTSLNDLSVNSSRSRVAVLFVEEVKYGGRLIVLDDESRCEVDETDAQTSKTWSELDRVIIIDGEMFRLDESEKVSVEQES